MRSISVPPENAMRAGGLAAAAFKEVLSKGGLDFFRECLRFIWREGTRDRKLLSRGWRDDHLLRDHLAVDDQGKVFTHLVHEPLANARGGGRFKAENHLGARVTSARDKPR